MLRTALIAALVCLAAQAAAGAELRAIDLDDSASGPSLMLRLSAPPPRTTWFALDDPERLVFDLRGDIDYRGPDVLDTHAPLVRRIRVGKHPDRVRVVLDLAGPYTDEPRLKPAGNTLRIELAPDRSAPADRAAATLPARAAPATSECEVLDPDIRGSYTGDCVNGLAHGNGTAAGRDSYTGEFDKGMKHGRGTYVYADGHRYQGSFRNDRRHGPGVFTAPDGTEYRGSFSNGFAHGVGQYVFPDGSTYRGELEQGLRQGYGVYEYADGTSYEGGWIADEKDGKGIFRSENATAASTFIGHYKNGKRHGYGKIIVRDKRSGMMRIERDGLWRTGRFISRPDDPASD